MREVDGLGLGLSIVRRLAEMLNLRVTLSSERGHGACFAIEGLVETRPGEPHRRKPRDQYERRLQGIRVLVVDDDRAARDGTVRLLVRWGCRVASSARPEFPANVPDFLICDHELGEGTSGLDFVRRVRLDAGFPVAAAIVTGGRVDEIAPACKDESIILLNKPVRPAQLRSALLSGLTAQSNPNSAAMPAAAERDGTSSVRNSADT